MRTPIGARVGALLSIQPSKAELLGFGVFDGLHAVESPPAPSWLAGKNNPRITLDNGKVVWGYECWWGEEAEITAALRDVKLVVNVDIDEARKRNSPKEEDED